MRGVIERLKIMSSFKKILGLFIIVSVRFFVNGLLYFLVLSRVVRGLMGVVSLSFYVYYLLVHRVWVIVIFFYMINLRINVNFKIIILGVLPLPLFFLKVRGIFCLYGVMVLSAIILMG